MEPPTVRRRVAAVPFLLLILLSTGCSSVASFGRNSIQRAPIFFPGKTPRKGNSTRKKLSPSQQPGTVSFEQKRESYLQRGRQQEENQESGEKLQQLRQEQQKHQQPEHHSLEYPPADANGNEVDTSLPRTAPTTSSKSLVIAFAGSLLLGTTGAAALGLLPGPVLSDGSTTGPYETAMIVRDATSTAATAALAILFVRVNTWACDRGFVEPRDSRKLIHTFSAPLFMLCWPLFSDAVGARFFAAIVPALNVIRLLRASSGSSDEVDLARAVSRTGDPKEALGGPFVYVLVMVAAILVFWRSSPPGVVALSAMAVGDGLADLIGRRLGANNKWPGIEKSVAGSVAFWVGSTLASMGLLLWLHGWGCLDLPFTGDRLFGTVAFICFLASVLELVPIGDDNYTVPLSAALLATLFLL